MSGVLMKASIFVLLACPILLAASGTSANTNTDNNTTTQSGPLSESESVLIYVKFDRVKLSESKADVIKNEILKPLTSSFFMKTVTVESKPLWEIFSEPMSWSRWF